jgi:asparagine synthase (glutamine-hydrolysing)
MCGIAGIFQPSGGNPAALEQLARHMAGTLMHRGPDDEGAWVDADGTIALSHRRLSIVDLSPLGRNPMSWDGGRLTITFNGEIYNFLELRAELELLGHRFRSHSDTEVVLAAYDQWGIACLQRFAGMFAFALWDAPRQRLWLVRDRIGKKPLFYVKHGESLAFASELKALAVLPQRRDAIDRTALQLYLRYGYIPAPFTIYADVRKLPPAHFLLAEAGRVSIARYWDPLTYAASGFSLHDDEAEAELDRRLGLAVSQRRIADVPLGAFLSGGIDSSLVVALMAEQTSRPVQTHTIRFDNPAFDEADQAAAVARHLHTDHHELRCDTAQLLDVVDRLPRMYDEPFADSSAIPTFLVSRAARGGVTVALSGDGGDELFFGYPRYRFYADVGWMLRLPAPLRALGAALARHSPTRRLRRIGDVLGSSADDEYTRFVEWSGADMVAALTGDAGPMPPAYASMLAAIGHLPRDARPGLLDLVSYLPDDILAKVDRASMAVGLEVRAPLLDHRVVEFALRLPPPLTHRGGVSKVILRRLLYKRVPQSLVDRPKMGFGVPLADWFRGPLRARMDDYCDSRAFEALGLNPAPLRRLWTQFTAGASVRPDLVWQAFCLAAWSREHVTQ